MVMNKRGQTIFVSLMLAIVFFILGYALAKPLTDVESNNMSNLHCSWVNLTNYYKGVCTSLDIFAPIFIGVIFGLAGACLGAVGIR